jgi:ClpP class serine protease
LEQDYFNIKNMPFVSGIYTDRHMKRSVEDLYDMEDWLARAYEEKRAGLDQESWTESHEIYREDIQTAKKLIVELIKSGVDVSDDERVDIGRMQVGLAREALGRSAITSNVSAWDLRKDEMPEAATKENETGDSFWNLLMQTARSKINSTTPSAVTKDFYANGLTAEQETERRAKVAEHAKEWLRKHANSPAVLEAYKKPATKAIRPKRKGFRPI